METVNKQIKNKFLYFGALIGLGFLWTGTAYIVHSYHLLKFLDGERVNLIVCGAYYILQAGGIGLVGFLFFKYPLFAGGPLLGFSSSIVLIASISLSLFSKSIGLIVATGAIINLMIGILSASYITRLATDIPHGGRGLVFGTAYALASIGTWILSLPMEGKLFWSKYSLIPIIILALISFLLLARLPLPPQQKSYGALRSRINKKFFFLAAGLIFLLFFQNTLGFSFPLKNALGNVYIEYTRAYYGIGLIMAGLINDKNRKWGSISSLAALAFPFAALALSNSMTGETIMWILAYIFLGFLAVYRILIFSDIAAKKELPALAVSGLLFGRLGEAAGTLGTSLLEGRPLIILSAMIFIFIIILFFPLYQKLYSTSPDSEEMKKQELLEYSIHYGISSREQEVFRLILQGKTNAEISTLLYISESTVKFHVSNIFKKTGLKNRSQLIKDFTLSKKD